VRHGSSVLVVVVEGDAPQDVSGGGGERRRCRGERPGRRGSGWRCRWACARPRHPHPSLILLDDISSLAKMCLLRWNQISFLGCERLLVVFG
jgi:hypothetical protein